MSFIYPRTISIARGAAQSGVGEIGYGGHVQADEDTLFTDIPASIQQKKEGGKPDAGLPGDTAKRTFWRIFFNLPNGSVNSRDIIIDELGVRYEVMAPYWNSLGYNCLCERLEV